MRGSTYGATPLLASQEGLMCSRRIPCAGLHVPQNWCAARTRREGARTRGQ